MPSASLSSLCGSERHPPASTSLRRTMRAFRLSSVAFLNEPCQSASKSAGEAAATQSRCESGFREGCPRRRWRRERDGGESESGGEAGREAGGEDTDRGEEGPETSKIRGETAVARVPRTASPPTSSSIPDRPDSPSLSAASSTAPNAPALPSSPSCSGSSFKSTLRARLPPRNGAASVTLSPRNAVGKVASRKPPPLAPLRTKLAVSTVLPTTNRGLRGGDGGDVEPGGEHRSITSPPTSLAERAPNPAPPAAEAPGRAPGDMREAGDGLGVPKTDRERRRKCSRTQLKAQIGNLQSRSPRGGHAAPTAARARQNGEKGALGRHPHRAASLGSRRRSLRAVPNAASRPLAE